MDDKEKRILLRLQNLCVRRECCEKDIYAKALKALEGDEEGANRILKQLVEDKFVSNLRYATAYAREKSSLSGWGTIKIKYMLSGKGISDEVISEALEEIDTKKATEKMEKILISKYKLIAENKDSKLKLLRYALSRGYNYEEVRPIVDKIVKGLI